MRKLHLPGRERFFLFDSVIEAKIKPEDLSEKDLVQLDEFQEKFKIHKKNVKFLIRFIQHELDNWIDRMEKMKNIKNSSLDFYLLQFGEKGSEYFEEFKSKSKQNLKNTKNYWIHRGFSEEEAQEKILEFQTKISHSSRDKNVGRKDRSILQFRFWMRQGMTEDQARQKVSAIQKHASSFSDYGAPGRASKESRKFFDPVMEFCIENGLKFNYGIEGSREFRLNHSGKIFMFDFAIPSIKLFLEYHGKMAHPCPVRLSETEWKEWTFPWDRFNSADEAFQHDQEKIKAANQAGFEVIVVWFDSGVEVIDQILEKIKICVQEKSQNHNPSKLEEL